MKFDLNRMRVLMRHLGDPQNNFPSIHVVGTNGKGSVAAMLTQILSDAGYKVGLYTSPHLEKINERFRIGNKLISDKEFHELSRYLQHQITSDKFKDKEPFRKKEKKISRDSAVLTEFEFLTAIAFLWFSRKKIDTAVVEAGLGGRLDATNVLDHVLASVITTVDLEHQEWLGHTIEQIAREKAGVIKGLTPVITAASGKALNIIRSAAKRKNAPVRRVNEPKTQIITNLEGPHQQINAALSLETSRMLREFFPKCHTPNNLKALGRVYWPGRFERFCLSGKQRDKEIILDGAHNPAAIRALVKTLKARGFNRVNLLFGVMKDKERRPMVKALAPFVGRVIAVQVPSMRSETPEKIAHMKEWNVKVETAPNFQIGLERLIHQTDNTPVLVTGSLYLVGAIRSILKSMRTRKI